jgi:hypothetical protein
VCGSASADSVHSGAYDACKPVGIVPAFKYSAFERRFRPPSSSYCRRCVLCECGGLNGLSRGCSSGRIRPPPQGFCWIGGHVPDMPCTTHHRFHLAMQSIDFSHLNSSVQPERIPALHRRGGGLRMAPFWAGQRRSSGRQLHNDALGLDISHPVECKQNKSADPTTAPAAIPDGNGRIRLAEQVGDRVDSTRPPVAFNQFPLETSSE